MIYGPEQNAGSAGKPDSGLACLVMLARLSGLPADPAQLRHQFGQSGRDFTVTDILRAALSLGLKAKEIETERSRLAQTHLPAIARHNNGHFFILAKVTEDQALIQDPWRQRPAGVSAEELQKRWNGRLILLTCRAGILSDFKRFD